jgi:hypothetical protein
MVSFEKRITFSKIFVGYRVKLVESGSGSGIEKECRVGCGCKNVDYVILWVVVRTSYGVCVDYKRDSGWLC